MAEEDVGAILPESIISGKYVLEEKLAEGGGGAVWRAHDPSGARIALKFLKWSPLKSKQAAADRFKSEFGILKNLSHPHIGKIYDFGVDAQTDSYFFTTELLTAGDLKDFVGGPIPVIEDLLLQSLRALEYLRNQGLLHLDLKPQNLLLRKGGKHPELALIDFGVASFRPPDKPGGTPTYMPPEIVARRLPELVAGTTWPAPDHRSDLYSLGVTFYYILTGHQPFRKTLPDGTRIDSQKTMAAHLAEDPAPPSAHREEIPFYLDRIIMKLMARQPDDRYPTAAIAAQAIQYRSPRRHRPESRATLLAYLPKEGRLIGRHAERELISQTCRAVAEGTPHAAAAIAIAGTRGTGVTRLLAAVKPLCQQYEMGVTWIDAANPQDAPSLDELMTTEASDQPRVQAILIDNLDALFVADHPSPAAENLFVSIQHLVRELALQARINDPNTRRFLLAFTWSSERTAFTRALLDLGLSEARCHVVRLTNFTAEEISEYLTNLLGEVPDADVVESLRAATDGNPLFITEHLEQMIARGQLFTLAGRPDLETLKAIGIDFATAPPPMALAATLREKLANLPNGARQVAKLLACLNRPATAEELSEFAPTRDVVHELPALVDAGLVKRGDGGAYRFANALAAKAIAESLTKQERATLHDAIASSLALRPTVSTAELDAHLAHGGDWAGRVGALERLARRSLEANQSHVAIEHLTQLLDELPGSAWQARADTFVLLGQASDRSHQHQLALAAFKEIEKIKAPSVFARIFQIRSLEQQGLSWMRRRELKPAKRLFAKATQLVTHGRTDLVWKLRLQNWLAAVDLRSGDADAARRTFEETWRLAADHLSDDELEAVSNNELGEATLAASDAAAAIPILERELAYAEAARKPERTATRRYLLGRAYAEVVPPVSESALEHYTQGLAIAKEHHLVDLQVRCHNGIGNLHSRDGRHEFAAGHYRTALHLAQQTESETVSAELMVNLGFVLGQIGRPADAVEYLEAALDFSKNPKGEAGVFIRKKQPDILIALGDALYRQRDFRRAEEYLSGAIRHDRQGALTPSMRYNLYGTLSEIYLARGEKDRAVALLPSLEQLIPHVPEARSHYDRLIREVERYPEE